MAYPMAHAEQYAALHAIAAHWRLAIDAPADGATNMATDVVNHDRARRSGHATLRLYGWSQPTLSFGRNERSRGRYDPARLAQAWIDVVRRPTGGRALLHHREVTYCVTAPLGACTPANAYRSINALLRASLERLGVRATLATPRGRAMRPDGAACFAEPAAGELVLDEAKLVGSAQLIEGGALLQHGSILLDDDQSRIVGLRASGTSANPTIAPVATLRRALGRGIGPSEVTRAIVETLRSAVTSVHSAESDEGISASVAAHRVRFTDSGWTWRR